MWELALRSAVILAIAWVIVRLLPRATAATRHLVWQTAIIAVLAAPLLSPLAPQFKVPWVSEIRAVLRVPAVPQVSNGIQSAQPADRTVLVAATPVNEGTARTQSTSDASSTVGRLVALLWPLGSVGFALWFMTGWAVTALSARRARRAPGNWQREANTIRQRLRIRREVDIRLLRDNTSPLAVGFWHSMILLPDAARSWDDDRRHSVLLHELAHIRRRDLHVEALAQLTCALYWFNPLAWLALTRLRAERERACDDIVLQSGARPSRYAADLLAIARQLRPALMPSAALAMARPSELEGRLLAVLAAKRARVPARGTRWAIVVIFAIVTAAALGASPTADDLLHDAALKPLPAMLPADWIQTPEPPSASERRSARRAVVKAPETRELAGDPQARKHAVLNLTASGDIDSVRLLHAALSDSDRDVREKAALALALMSTPEVIPSLLHALADSDSQVREKAAIGLAMRRDARVTDALVAAIHDPDSQVREKVAIALGTSGDARAMAPLERALRDPDSQVREKAVTGLMLLRSGAGDSAEADRARDGLRRLIGALIGR